jgi:hypothetical protein
LYVVGIETTYNVVLLLKHIEKLLKLVHYSLQLQREILTTALSKFGFQGQPFH